LRHTKRKIEKKPRPKLSDKCEGKERGAKEGLLLYPAVLGLESSS
jgi:hypothetical protein